ncbi:hypothetical protein KRX51_02185 [Corynebacterium sp. TAE3-ERU12]|uniref:hypothetical protein n=1 Tax=Corynebacterium sp. TAE3-ERU12 TaxID=2849491 RepID=UPI001C473D7F|nr:hypothetical protein [Corynebacterium sp. TAE3-ERU12]MBV7294728.1 hypothetical protein [Corynebacterium sp. TAE3-ERU12]
MSENPNRGTSGIEPIPSVEELAADDAFLTAISEGDVAAGAGAYGTDSALAEMMIGLCDEVDADMPPTPHLPADFGRATGPAGSAEKTAEQPKRDDNVVPLRQRMMPGRLSSAGIGAAAAAVVLVGGLGLINNAEPGSALWPLREQLQGDQSLSVQLASTIDEADAAADSGDKEKAERLLDHARVLLQQVRAEDRAMMEERMERAQQKVRTIVVTTTVVRDGSTTVVTEPAKPARTETVTETVTETTTEAAAVPTAPNAEPEDADNGSPSTPMSSTRSAPSSTQDNFRGGVSRTPGFQNQEQRTPASGSTTVPPRSGGSSTQPTTESAE